MTIRGIIFDLDDTLTYGFMHPEVQGQPLPDVVDLLRQLRVQGIPMAVATNQAGPLYHHFQQEIMNHNPWWKRKDYPTTQKVAEDLASSLKLLEIPHVPLFVSVYDPRLTSLLDPFPDQPSTYPLAVEMEVAEQIAHEIKEYLTALGITAFVGWEEQWRKPNPLMLNAAVQYWGEPFVPKTMSEYRYYAYVGDMHTNKNGMMGSDRATAENAGMTFVKAEEIQTLLSLVAR